MSPELTLLSQVPVLRNGTQGSEGVKQRFLSQEQDEHHRLLVPITAENHWSDFQGKYRKDWMPSLVAGQEASHRDSNAEKMERHIRGSSLSRAMYPVRSKDRDDFKSIKVPIIDILAIETEKKFSWNYPSH